jgi:trimeric autotransporter adhesin
MPSLALLLPLLVAAGCGGDSGVEPRSATAVIIESGPIAMAVGQSQTVTASFADRDGEPVPSTGQVVTWTSTRTSVATVSNGTIHAVGPGTATITASSPGLTSATVQVTVSQPLLSANLGFTYTGDREGEFRVAAEFLIGPNGPTGGDWAATFHDATHGSQDLIAFRQRSDGKFDLLWVWTDGPQVTSAGTRTLDDGVFAVGIAPDGESWEQTYGVMSGSVTFNAPSAGRVTGTFTIELANTVTDAPLTVSAGTFDVPVLRLDQVFPSYAALRADAGKPVESMLRLPR